MSTGVVPSVQTESVSAAAAHELVAAAVRKAEETGITISVAVLDTAGLLKALLRMDGTTLRSLEVAQRKAYSAVSFGLATEKWYDLMKDDGEMLTGLPHLDRFTVLGGGRPLNLSGTLVGSIGISGGPTAEADIACVVAALEHVGFDVD